MTEDTAKYKKLKVIFSQADQQVVEGDFKDRTEVNRTITEIYEKYDSWLERFLFGRLNSMEAIEDVKQEVYLRLVKYPDARKLRLSLSLLRTIASNILVDRFRAQRERLLRVHVSADDVELRAPDPLPDEVLLSKEGVDKMTRIFEVLTDNCRKAFVR